MRRVDRGAWPLDGGLPRQFRPYRKAKRDLLERLGRYCSYCERTKCDLHVEHVVPRCQRPDLEEEWTNFLLGCVNCNSIKRNRNTSRDGYTWPDDDERWNPFEYLPEGIVRVRPDLPDSRRVKAENLSELVGLERRPGNDPTASDLRWRDRREAWRIAEMACKKLDRGLDMDVLVVLAKETGFWSVWTTIFSDYPEVCGRLRDAFPGTR